MAAVLTELLRIEEAVLVSMAGNPVFVKEFSFLKGLAQLRKKKTGCTRCKQGAGKRVQLINGAKQAIVNMGAEKKRRLKVLLRTKKVRVRVASAGAVKEHTF
jgi:CO dehydrogenase/acetyl-CoA synthase alpha subunit